MAHPMGESKPGCLRVVFDRRLKLEFHGSKITSDAGLLAYVSGELAEWLDDKKWDTSGVHYITRKHRARSSDGIRP